MLDAYRDLNSTATFNQWAGFEVVRMGEGECELRMP
jgi:acyl-coenzyme A thioesterase PaaI-like protein